MQIYGRQADLRRGVVLVVLATMVAFPVAISAAIAFYPGHDEAIHGYRFWNDFLSALGETRTPAGHDNFRACLIFNIALGFAMLAVIPYWHIRSDCLRGPKFLRWLTFLCCTGFSLGVVGVAAAPYNLWPHLHNTCVYTAFAVIVPGVLLLVLASDPALVGWRYRLGWAVFAVVLLLSEWLLGRLDSQHLLPDYPLPPILQKINVAVFFGWLVGDLWLFNAYLSRREAANTRAS
jgi:ABC-type sugar transport system permease subunit